MSGFMGSRVTRAGAGKRPTPFACYLVRDPFLGNNLLDKMSTKRKTENATGRKCSTEPSWKQLLARAQRLSELSQAMLDVSRSMSRSALTEAVQHADREKPERLLGQLSVAEDR